MQRLGLKLFQGHNHWFLDLWHLQWKLCTCNPQRRKETFNAGEIETCCSHLTCTPESAPGQVDLERLYNRCIHEHFCLLRISWLQRGQSKFGFHRSEDTMLLTLSILLCRSQPVDVILYPVLSIVLMVVHFVFSSFNLLLFELEQQKL